MWKPVLKLLTTATKISWQYELIDAFLSVVGGGGGGGGGAGRGGGGGGGGGVQGDRPVGYGMLTPLAGLTFLHFGSPS